MCTRSRKFEPFTSDGETQGFDQQERDCFFTCKLLCCKCSFCYRVATKERRKSQFLSKIHGNKICERCFLCRSLEFCKYCHQCPNCCHKSTCRGKATSVLGEVGSSGFESKSSHNTERRLNPPLLVQTQSNQVTNCHKQLCKPTKTVPPFGGTVSADKQKCSGTGSKPKLTGVLQPAIFGTQTQQPVETYPGPEHLEHLPKHRVIQNGDPRDNKDLPTAGGVGHLHRLQGRILPCRHIPIHSQSRKYMRFHILGQSYQFKALPFWSVHSTHGVHSDGQRGQTDGFTEGYKNPPVPRRLVGESHIPPNLSPAYTDIGSSLSRIRLAGEQGEVRTGSKTGFQLRRLPVRPQGGQGQAPSRELADLNRQNIVNSVRSGVPGPAVHVHDRTSNSHRKASPSRLTSYETHTLAPEEQLEGTRITRKGDTRPQVAPPSLKMVAGGKQCASWSTITPTKTCSADIYRRIKRRLGRSLKRTHCKGNLVPSRKLIAHKSFGTKGGLSGPKRVPRPLFRLVTLKACHIPGRLNVIADKLSRLGQTNQTEWCFKKCFKLYAPGGTSPKWTCLPPDSTTNSHILCHQFQTPRLG